MGGDTSARRRFVASCLGALSVAVVLPLLGLAGIQWWFYGPAPGKPDVTDLMRAYVEAARRGDVGVVRSLVHGENVGLLRIEGDVGRALERYAGRRDVSFRVVFAPDAVVGYYCSADVWGVSDRGRVDRLY